MLFIFLLSLSAISFLFLFFFRRIFMYFLLMGVCVASQYIPLKNDENKQDSQLVIRKMELFSSYIVAFLLWRYSSQDSLLYSLSLSLSIFLTLSNRECDTLERWLFYIIWLKSKATFKKNQPITCQSLSDGAVRERMAEKVIFHNMKWTKLSNVWKFSPKKHKSLHELIKQWR